MIAIIESLLLYSEPHHSYNKTLSGLKPSGFFSEGFLLIINELCHFKKIF